MSKSLKTQWRVEVRSDRNCPWRKHAIYETRSVARTSAAQLRSRIYGGFGKYLPDSGYGFGNTRVVKYVRAGK